MANLKDLEKLKKYLDSMPFREQVLFAHSVNYHVISDLLGNQNRLLIIYLLLESKKDNTPITKSGVWQKLNSNGIKISYKSTHEHLEKLKEEGYVSFKTVPEENNASYITIHTETIKEVLNNTLWLINELLVKQLD